MMNYGSDRIFLCRQPVDLRKGYDGLIGLTKTVLKENPLSGAYFVFLNPARNRIKILYWDSDGFCIWMKKSATGSFALSEGEYGDKQALDRTMLFMLLEGIKKVKKSKRFQCGDPVWYMGAGNGARKWQ